VTPPNKSPSATSAFFMAFLLTQAHGRNRLTLPSFFILACGLSLLS
jgi:hypothetical protein